MEKKHQNILYVDDEQGNLVGFKASFSSKFTVFTANSTQQAEAILAEESIEVILVDYKMPGEDGISFILRIKDQYPEIVKILITAYAETEIAIEAVNSRAFYAFVAKPWEYEQLSMIIKNALEKYELENERKQLVLQLQETLEKEQRANAVKDIFLRNISHEIRTPLNGIMGFSSLLAEGGRYPDIQHMLEAIYNSGERLMYTMQSIIDSSLIIGQQLKCETKEFDLNKLLRSVVDRVQNRYKEKGVSKIIYFKEDRYPCLNDEDKIQVILDKLVDNAFKFSNSEVEIEFDLNLDIETNLYTLSVGNQGDKVDESDYKTLFDSFMSVDNSMSRKFEGLGLGLFIAKSYANFLGGDLCMVPNESKNVFCVTLKKEYSL